MVHIICNQNVDGNSDHRSKELSTVPETASFPLFRLLAYRKVAICLWTPHFLRLALVQDCIYCVYYCALRTKCNTNN